MDQDDRNVRCFMCQTVLAKCACGDKPAEGFGQCCTPHVSMLDEAQKFAAIPDIMAMAVVQAFDFLDQETATEICQRGWARVIKYDCDRIHHAVLTGDLTLDPLRYTPRLDIDRALQETHDLAMDDEAVRS